MDGKTIFGDRDTALILQKAAELQAERGGRSSGLTLEDLRQIAGEAGIEPHLVEEAVALLQRQAQSPQPSRRKSRSGETRWEQRVELPVHLNNEDVRAILARLEAEFGGQGTITELSCGTVWTMYRMRDGHTHAAVEARDRGTRLHVAFERSTQRKFLRRAGAVVGGFLFSFAGIATGDEGALMFLTSLGLVAGNLHRPRRLARACPEVGSPSRPPHIHAFRRSDAQRHARRNRIRRLDSHRSHGLHVTLADRPCGARARLTQARQSVAGRVLRQRRIQGITGYSADAYPNL